jgi:hypothetical protein
MRGALEDNGRNRNIHMSIVFMKIMLSDMPPIYIYGSSSSHIRSEGENKKKKKKSKNDAQCERNNEIQLLHALHVFHIFMYERERE